MSSREDIIKNRQKDYKQIRYLLDNMMAYSDVGKIKENQEDAILIDQYPTNDRFKILAIADGMGGLESGEVASNTALYELTNWFLNLNSNMFYKKEKIYKSLYSKLKEIDELITNKCNGATTLAYSIVLNNETLIGNIGDSRTYIVKENILRQIGFDHSVVWNYYLWKTIKNRDDMRFHINSNLVCSALGGKTTFELNTNLIENNNYDDIFLFSDGVTDCLSEQYIEKLILNNKEDIDKIIVNEALNSYCIKSSLDERMYYHEIEGGKDNTSVACLIKGVNKK